MNPFAGNDGYMQQAQAGQATWQQYHGMQPAQQYAPWSRAPAPNQHAAPAGYAPQPEAYSEHQQYAAPPDALAYNALQPAYASQPPAYNVNPPLPSSDPPLPSHAPPPYQFASPPLPTSPYSAGPDAPSYSYPSTSQAAPTFSSPQAPVVSHGPHAIPTMPPLPETAYNPYLASEAEQRADLWAQHAHAAAAQPMYAHAAPYQPGAANGSHAAYAAYHPHHGYQGSAYGAGVAAAPAYLPSAAYQSTFAYAGGVSASQPYHPAAAYHHSFAYMGGDAAAAGAAQYDAVAAAQQPYMPAQSHAYAPLSAAPAVAGGVSSEQPEQAPGTNDVADVQQPEAPAEPAPVSPPTSALDLFVEPARATRPKAFVVIVRGIPGSGKSFIAARLRKLELDAGGQAPRVHSIDAYFLNEVDGAADGTRGKRPVKVEEYEHDPTMEAAYEESLLKAYARTLAEGQHLFVIVDAPLLQAARLHDFWTTAKAAGFEVYVAQSPSQDPQECFKRNIHGRMFVDIQRSSGSLEPPPPAMATLDVACILQAHAAADGAARDGKRKAAEPAHADGPPPTPGATESAGQGQGSGSKRAKGSAVNDDDLLALIDKGFMHMDEGGEARRGAGAAAANGARPSPAVAKSRWENSDDEEDASPPSISASKPSDADTKIKELLSARTKAMKKTVRWPDQEPEDDGVDAFRIGRPRQLVTIHFVEGLGPAPDNDSDNEHPVCRSFTQAARAEHEVERQRHTPGGWT